MLLAVFKHELKHNLVDTFGAGKWKPSMGGLNVEVWNNNPTCEWCK
jgi:hypothetical protein